MLPSPRMHLARRVIRLQNDHFFPMWNMQLYFLVSELAIATALLVLCDRDIPVTPTTSWFVVSMAVAIASRCCFDLLSALSSLVQRPSELCL